MSAAVSASSDLPGRTVKFWFLANYASPAFRTYMPRMAAAMGFEIGFVTYKWPSWLRRQTVKQRVREQASPPRNSVSAPAHAKHPG